MPLRTSVSKIWNKEAKPWIHNNFRKKSSSSEDEAPPPAEEQPSSVVNIEPSPPPPPLPQEAPSVPIDPTPESTSIPEPLPHPPTPLRPIQRRPILPVLEATLCEFTEADFCDTFSHNSYIGSGSGGNVYRRKHPTYGKVAVKHLSTQCEEHSKIREITSALIRHPGIVNFYGFLYQDKKVVGFVMEYLETDLERVIPDTNYTYSLVQLVDWMVDIAGTLAEMHKRRIIHRDIKSANILLHYDEKTNSLGTAKLCDFGISRVISSKTKTYGIGTKYYMAPEICGLQEDPPLLYNEKVDVFGLGVVLWELLHRRLRSDRDKSWDPIFHISPKLRNVVESCMLHDPDQRPTMTELKKQLEEENPALV